MVEPVFQLVDDLVNVRERLMVFSDRIGGTMPFVHVRAMDKKVAEWSKESQVIWNTGIGLEGSFVRTLGRLLFERTIDMYGPYDHVTCVRLRPTTAADSRAAKRWLPFEVLMEMARTLNVPQLDDKLQELKQLAAEESYFGYGTISEDLMLQSLGAFYVVYSYLASDPSIHEDPRFMRPPRFSPLLKKTREALEGKRHLLVIENLHVPVSLEVLAYIMGGRPSPYQQNRWLISTTSKDVWDKSRYADELKTRGGSLNIKKENYHALPTDDLDKLEWAMLIKEAIRDAASSIHSALQHQGRGFMFWLRVAQHCLYYGILYHPVQGSAVGRQATSNITVSSDELVRCWVAEGLLFPVTSPTDIPAASSKEGSDYYRSAYEAGKVVIQALQEYSLLPIYSVSSPLEAVTGMSKLVTGVPRLKQDELVDHEKSDQLRWVSFMNDDGRHVSWDWDRRSQEAKFIPGEMTMSTLILRGSSNIYGFPFNKLLNHHLCVLDLSYTLISSLPRFSRLLNLHLLSLRGCSHLETLSPPPSTSEEETAPLAYLGNLQVLDMNGVPLLEMTQQDGSNKRNLHYLDLSGSRISTLPSEFFHGMSSLEELILINCSNLKELPSSMAELSNLLVLHVEGSQIISFPEDMFEEMQRLHVLKLINNKLLMSLPRSLSEAKGLKELHIYDCIRLRLQFFWVLLSYLEDLYIQTWEALEDIKILGHPVLRTFSLSGPWIRFLSLRGCSRLKTVNFSDDLTALEDVDLSGTAIEEVPHNLPNLPQLRMLLLLNVPCFKRFPWLKLVRFPKVFYLDHCAEDDNQILNMFCQQKKCTAGNQHREETTNTAQININDPRMFHSFNTDAANKLVKEGQFLQSFNVQIKPCSLRSTEAKNKEVEICIEDKGKLAYPDVCYSEAASIFPMMKLQPRQRHVHISSNNQYPNGLRHLLFVTNSMLITDDAFVRCLTDLNYSLICLEECQIQCCHQMTAVFSMKLDGSETLSSLKILQASCLNNLQCFVEPVMPPLSPWPDSSMLITLKLLKHIHLEHCPRLEKLFPCSLSLPALETLVILFCSNLKKIFYKQYDGYGRYEVAPSPLPNIRSIYFQELPQLQHIHYDVMFCFETPKWEKLYVRGCRSLQRLPPLKMEHPKSKVEVSGEHDWWDRLQWSLPEQSEYYLHMPPPKFTSQKKHIIESYLR